MRILDTELQRFKHEARIMLFGCEKKGGRPLSVERRNALEKASPGSTCAVKGAKGQTLYYKKTGASPGAKAESTKGKTVKKSSKATKIAKAAKAAHITKRKPKAKPTRTKTAKPEVKPTRTKTAKPEAKPTRTRTAKPEAKPTRIKRAKPEVKPTRTKRAKPEVKKEEIRKDEAPKTLVEKRPKDLKGIDAIKWHLEEIKKNPEFQKTLKEHPALFYSLFESAENFHKPPTKELTEESLSKDFRYVYNLYHKQNPQAVGRATIPVLHDLLREIGYGLSTKEFHDFLKKWSKEDKVYLEVCDSPGLAARSKEGISTERGVLLYVLPKKEWENLISQEEKSYPEYKSDYFVRNSGLKTAPKTPTPKPEAKPTPKPEVKPTPKTEVKPTPKTEVKPTPKPEPEATPTLKQPEVTLSPAREKARKALEEQEKLTREEDEELKTPLGRTIRGLKNLIGIH